VTSDLQNHAATAMKRTIEEGQSIAFDAAPPLLELADTGGHRVTPTAS
jgi:hypothetical protein